jgi:hypothetical protein
MHVRRSKRFGFDRSWNPALGGPTGSFAWRGKQVSAGVRQATVGTRRNRAGVIFGMGTCEARRLFVRGTPGGWRGKGGYNQPLFANTQD